MNYSFHMPGHKRNPAFLKETDVARLTNGAHPLYGAFLIDTTETEETDDLHHAEGILKEAQERAGALYRNRIREKKKDASLLADMETHYLVGGATAGVLSAVSAVCGEGGTVVAARNAHRSFYHALFLSGARAAYVVPKPAADGSRILPFPGPVSPEEIEMALQAHPGAAAVFCTSPTYEGVVSPIAGIARCAHEKGIPLIVDEAHGAHFSLDGRLPESAIAQGADIVIRSVHKTLAALTQTALLHVQGELVDRKKLARFLAVFQSSSPSYVLMSSIDTALRDMEAHAGERFDTLFSFRQQIEEAAAGWKHLYPVPRTVAQDPCKLTILAKNASGVRQILRDEYHIEAETADDARLILILTPYDTKEGTDALCDALCRIDRALAATCGRHPEQEVIEGKEAAAPAVWSRIPGASGLTIREAWDAPSEETGLSGAAGRISADFLYAYPPGIPLIAPGEIYDAQLIEMIQTLDASGVKLHGMEKGTRVRVLI